MIHATSSSSETTFSIYLKGELHGNKRAGVWRWHASSLCLDTKTNSKWWNWQRTCCCLISDYAPLQTAATAEWSWYYSSEVQSQLQMKHTMCGVCFLWVKHKSTTDKSPGLKSGTRTDQIQRRTHIKEQYICITLCFHLQNSCTSPLSSQDERKKRTHQTKMVAARFQQRGRYVLLTNE